MATTYTPRTDTLPAQVIGFFTNNRDEELGLDDIVDKFSCTRGNIHTQLRLAVEAGLLKRDRNADGEYIYKRGFYGTTKPQGVDMDAVHNRPGAQADAAPDPTGKIVFDGVAIDTDVPFPRHNRKDWTPLLRQLKPGHSFVRPIREKYAIAKDIRAEHQSGRAKFTLRTFPDTEVLRVWRVS